MSEEKPSKPSLASLAGRVMVEARWAKTTPEERRELASRRGKLGGRPPRVTAPEPEKARRCFCGRDSMWRACLRNFLCCRQAGVMTLHLAVGRPAERDRATPAQEACRE